MSFCELDVAYNHFVLSFCASFVSHLSTLCLSISCFKRCVCSVYMRFFHQGQVA